MMKVLDKPIGNRPDADDKRISRPEASLRTAAIWAHRGTCPRKKVGAVIAIDGRIIATGYNGSPKGEPHCTDVGCEIDPITQGCIRATHAEVNAIQDAIERGISLVGATMYTTYSPCLACAGAIIRAGITEVVYYHPYRDSAGTDLLIANGRIDFWKFSDHYNLLLPDLEELK